ncbi:MAG: hypothetical protein IH987_00730 [Planctomycetes bacterium]|nr:hypothetical protein [Planctomycetota bacterium]
MTTEDEKQDESGGPRPESEQAPQIEDAYEPEKSADDFPGEDSPELLSGLSRGLEDQPEDSEGIDAAALDASNAAAVAARDDDSDTAANLEESRGAGEDDQPEKDIDWESELSAHKVVVALKRIETEVRSLLDGVDGKRKRKLSGSRRWRELEEDLIGWQHTSRINHSAHKRLVELVVRRDYLFRRLVFLSRTRQVWNS